MEGKREYPTFQTINPEADEDIHYCKKLSISSLYHKNQLIGVVSLPLSSPIS